MIGIAKLESPFTPFAGNPNGDSGRTAYQHGAFLLFSTGRLPRAGHRANVCGVSVKIYCEQCTKDNACCLTMCSVNRSTHKLGALDSQSVGFSSSKLQWRRLVDKKLGIILNIDWRM